MISLPAPTISPGGGTFCSCLPPRVRIEAGEGTRIHFTCDGSLPTSKSQVFDSPFTIRTTTTVKAVAVVGDVCSEPAQRVYVVSEKPVHMAVLTWLCSLCGVAMGQGEGGETYSRIAQDDHTPRSVEDSDSEEEGDGYWSNPR